MNDPAQELEALEAQLAELRPAPLSTLSQARIEKAIAHRHDQPASVSPAADKKISTGHFQWRAAAVVALMGALTAFFVTQPEKASEKISSNADRQPSHIARTTPSPSVIPAAIDPAAIPLMDRFTPVSTNRNFLGFADDGVVRCSKNEPHRCIRVEYQEKVHYENLRGHKVDIAKPAVDYYVLPIETD